LSRVTPLPSQRSDRLVDHGRDALHKRMHNQP